MLGWVQDVLLQIDTLQFLKFKQRYVRSKTSKDGIILIDYFHLKFKSLVDHENNYQIYLSGAVLKNICR